MVRGRRGAVESAPTRPRAGVDDDVANVLVAQLLYLANEDPTKDITLYINSSLSE